MLDTHELGRRPGTQVEVSRTVPAREDLGIDVLAVPAEAQLHLELRCEAVMEGVLVTGTVEAVAVGECVRCLEKIEYPVSVEFQELYTYDDEDSSDAGDEDEEEVSRTEGDLVDLEPAVRTSVVLALPLQPHCTEDCPGLCPQCGARLADDPDHAHEAPVDPRLAGLAGLRDQLAEEQQDPTQDDAQHRPDQ